MIYYLPKVKRLGDVSSILNQSGSDRNKIQSYRFSFEAFSITSLLLSRGNSM
jgi:hypothetical protein